VVILQFGVLLQLNVSLSNAALDPAMRASASSPAAVRGAGALLCEAYATALLPRIRPCTGSGWDASAP
jgi:hypothetical protein